MGETQTSRLRCAQTNIIECARMQSDNERQSKSETIIRVEATCPLIELLMIHLFTWLFIAARAHADNKSGRSQQLLYLSQYNNCTYVHKQHASAPAAYIRTISFCAVGLTQHLIYSCVCVYSISEQREIKAATSRNIDKKMMLAIFI